MKMTYRNCSIEPHPGDLVEWNGEPNRVVSIGPESATFVNCKFGGNLHVNRPDAIDLIETYDGRKPPPLV
jgi:hypothetical protein